MVIGLDIEMGYTLLMGEGISGIAFHYAIVAVFPKRRLMQHWRNRESDGVTEWQKK